MRGQRTNICVNLVVAKYSALRHALLKWLRRKQPVSSKFSQELHGLLIPIGFRAATSDVFILRNSPRLLTSHVVYLSSWHKEISLGYLCRRNSFSFSERFSLSVTLPVSQASSFQHGSTRRITQKKCSLAIRKFSCYHNINNSNNTYCMTLYHYY